MGGARLTHEGALAQRFELRQKLGEGGMGVVYRAWDRTLGKEVALKRMLEIGATQAQRLKSEFRARSALQHKNLVQLFENLRAIPFEVAERQLDLRRGRRHVAPVRLREEAPAVRLVEVDAEAEAGEHARRLLIARERGTSEV